MHAPVKIVRAAQYVRMSREKQVYSPANQQAAIAAYAQLNGFEIVRSYIDEGRSGLRIKGRLALQEMLRDVLSGDPGYAAILVFDVSRWGRFQDADESAHYEFICRRAGVAVHYCGEMFVNDGSLLSTVFKNMRRAMAGEFSRDLSAKVWTGQCRLVSMGYKMGGTAGYGHSRLLVDGEGRPKQILRDGEHKSITTDRVTLIPGDPAEVETVKRIYRLAQSGMPNPDIASELNSDGVPGPTGDQWSKHMIRNILINEKYAGTAIYNRRSAKLGSRPRPNAPATWVRCENAFEPLVPLATFRSVQGTVRSARPVYSDADLLEHLRQLLSEHGFLLKSLIDAAGPPAAKTYSNRFGSLANSYARIGYDPSTRDAHSVAGQARASLVAEAVASLRSSGKRPTIDMARGTIVLSDPLTISVRVCRVRSGPTYDYWRVKLPRSRSADFVLAALLRDDACEHVYLFPAGRFGKSGKIDVRDARNLVEQYRVVSFEYLYEMMLRCSP